MTSRTYLIGIFMIFAFTSKGQTIVSKNNQFGIIGTDGSFILEMYYDSIYKFLPHHEQIQLYVCRSKSSTFFYDAKIKKKYEWNIDLIETNRDGLTTFKSKMLTGYLAFITVNEGYSSKIAAYRLFAPTFISVNNAWTQVNTELSVKGENGFGLIQYETGDTIIPLKFKHPVSSYQPSTYQKYYKSSDNKGVDSTIYINPKTYSTFTFHPNTEVLIPINDSILQATTTFKTENEGCYEVFNYTTGERIFHHALFYNHLIYNYREINMEKLDKRTVKFTIERQQKDNFRYSYIISVYDIYSGNRLYYLESFQYKDIRMDYSSKCTTGKGYLLVDRMDKTHKNKIAGQLNNYGTMVWNQTK
jgi:hypothetical protein